MISNSIFLHQIIIESCYNKFLIIAAYFHVALTLEPLMAEWQKLNNDDKTAENSKMLRKFGSRVISRCRLRKCNQISLNSFYAW